MNDPKRQLAERVRSACVQAALEAYEHAGLSGLCAAGRWEYTIGVLREMDLAPLLAKPTGEAPEEGGARAGGD
ncbi:MAG: acetyltransferase [Candidatus Competibacteraceae bacterium]|nr:acetyltransferase [Candidatus Competibacteraceae bacterium]